jgi:hypothetical protein
MRAVVGLVVLGLVGGVVPTGLAGFAHAGQVLAGTVGALLSLAVCCVTGQWLLATGRDADRASPLGNDLRGKNGAAAGGVNVRIEINSPRFRPFSVRTHPGMGVAAGRTVKVARARDDGLLHARDRRSLGWVEDFFGDDES